MTQLSAKKTISSFRKSTKTFKSKYGVILSCLGAAVGAGNIWRFPRIVANNAGENGALGFLIAWFLFLFTYSIPILIIEYGIGRYTKCASIVSFKKMKGVKTMWCGAFVGFVAFAVGSYYSVICGWCAYYFLYYIANPLPSDVADSQKAFVNFAVDSRWPVLMQALVIFISGLCISSGVRSIEPVMMVMVPLLLLMMFGSFAYSLTLPHASTGVIYLFSMDWDVLKNPNTWIDALTQNEWDTGAASGVLLVYATYFGRKHGIVKYATLIPTVNNILSLLMGITMFATVFSLQIMKNEDISKTKILDAFKFNGPANTGLTFIWIPILYSSLYFGRALTVAFFLCLFLAGFSSQISFIEAACHQLVDLSVPRKTAVNLICIFTFFFGLGSAVNVNVLVNQDFVWGSAYSVSGLFIIYLVMSFGVSKFRNQVVNNYGDGSDWTLPYLWQWVIWVLTPVQVTSIFVWWIVSNISNNSDTWYIVQEPSIMSAFVQWFVVLVVLIGINYAYVKHKTKIMIWFPFLSKLFSSDNSSSCSISTIASNPKLIQMEPISFGESQKDDNNNLNHLTEDNIIGQSKL